MMTIRLKNESKYHGKKGETDWWEWTVFLEADTKNELDDVEYVIYQLHSTFNPPVVKVTERKGLYTAEIAILNEVLERRGFPLTKLGKGYFVVYARVKFKSEKTPLFLEHQLELKPIEEDKPYITGY